MKTREQLQQENDELRDLIERLKAQLVKALNELTETPRKVE